MIHSLRESVGQVLANAGAADVVLVHFDGACEPKNPGGVATGGWTVRKNGELIGSGYREVRRGDGATNNVAEWCALGLALRWMLDNGIGGKCLVEIRGDSQLVVKQLNDEWACRKEHLQKLRDRCRALLQEISPASWRSVWIPREENSEADALSRKAYEEATGTSFPERARR